ncbi:hypothetical protein [Microbulbifer sediminum]|uniref:hypothetical protein n=1 Tax=Microbulbifer sediminum TaxID=2904250 RepID=UPI001F1A37B4|nr:hypothetical protein [Microbulbifer sediminum]
MSGRKNKNRQRGQRHQQQRRQAGSGEPRELLDELNSIRDLLGSEELGDIPLLDQVAEPPPSAPPASPDRPGPSRPRLQPLEDADLPTLFSPEDEDPVEEELAADPVAPPPAAPGISTELSAAERALLRPLEALPGEMGAHPARAGSTGGEQQQELFGDPDSDTAGMENPFLPAHIRARLTGGRVPRSQETETMPGPAADAPSPEADSPISAGDPDGPADLEVEQSEAATGDAVPAPGPGNERPSRAMQRQQLIEKLVARQLPELERQLRARIEVMVDELMRRR